MKKTTTKTVKELREEATKILKKDRTDYAMRSCWKCNGAHEHLRDAEYIIMCFDCGHWYYKGVDITVPNTKKQ